MNEAGRVLLRYEPRMRAYFHACTRGRDTVDELVQEAACAVLASYHRCENTADPTAWVLGVCRNVLRVWRRRCRTANCLPLYDQPVEDRPRTDVLAVEIALEELPGPYRRLFECYYRRAQPVESIARELDLPVGTVKYRLHRLRALLREGLD